MSTTQITWKIESIEAIPQLGEHTNVVKYVNWKADAKLDSYTSGTWGKVELKEPTNGFIEYSNLAESQVLEWVKNSLGPARVAEIEADLKAVIDAQINPPIITPELPWAPPTTPTVPGT